MTFSSFPPDQQTPEAAGRERYAPSPDSTIPDIPAQGAQPVPQPTYGYDQRPPMYASDGGGYPPFPGGDPGPQPAARRGLRVPPWLLALLAAVLLIAGVGVGFALSHGATTITRSPTPAAHAVATLPVASSAQDLQQQVEDVIKTVQPTVVQVQSQGSQGSAIGSGEIVTSDGYIVTNDHVVTGFSQYAVLLFNGKTYPATLVGESPQDDLAVLKISAGTALQTIAFGDSSKAQVGQFVVALGSPLGLQQSATFGIVSALNRTASEGTDGPAQELTGLIQTSAPINPGNSGGALVNLSGQLIGVPTLGAIDPNSGGSANGIGFAIPSNRVHFVAQQLIQHGRLVNSGQGFLGVQGEDVTPQVATSDHLGTQSGVLVVAFAAAASGQSPAQTAGLKLGDVITAVNDQAVSSNNDLAAALQSASPGARVKITYMRGSSRNSVTVTLGERPTNAG